MKIVQQDINELIDDKFELFSFRNKIVLNPFGVKDDGPLPYSKTQYNESLLNELLNFLANKCTELTCHYENKVHPRKVTLEQAMEDIKGNKVLYVSFPEQEKKLLKDEFLQTLLNRDLKIVEGLFWNCDILGANKYFRKKGLLAVGPADRTCIDILHTGDNYSSHKSSHYDVNLIVKHHASLFGALYDLYSLWKKYQAANEEMYAHFSSWNRKGDFQKIKQKDFLIRSMIGLLVYKQPLEQIGQILQAHQEILQENTIVKFFKVLDKKLFNDVLKLYDAKVDDSKTLNGIEIKVQEEELEQKTYKIDRDAMASKYHVQFSDVNRLLSHALMFLNQNFRMKACSFDENDTLNIIFYGTSDQLMLCKQFLQAVVNDEQFIRNKDDKTTEFKKLMAFLELDAKLETSNIVMPKPKI